MTERHNAGLPRIREALRTEAPRCRQPIGYRTDDSGTQPERDRLDNAIAALLRVRSDEFPAQLCNRATNSRFDLESEISIRPELSDWKTGNYKPLKRWPPLRQRLTYLGK